MGAHFALALVLGIITAIVGFFSVVFSCPCFQVLVIVVCWGNGRFISCCSPGRNHRLWARRAPRMNVFVKRTWV